MASTKGRRPPLPPSPLEKAVVIRPHGKGRNKRRSLSALSCFRGSPVADSEVGHSISAHRKAAWFSWPKKTTVPVDTPATALTPGETRHDGAWRKGGGDGRDGEGERPAGLQRRRRQAQKRIPAAEAAAEEPCQGFFAQKGNRSSACTGSPPKHVEWSHAHRQQQQQPLHIPFVYTKYGVRRGQPAPASVPQPAPALSSCSCSPRAIQVPAVPAASPACTRKPAGTSGFGGTGLRNRSKESSSAGRRDQVSGLSVLALVLLLGMLFGRASAVVATCVWLYLLPRLSGAARETTGGGSRCFGDVDLDSEDCKRGVVLENGDVDLDSKEHKRRVVLEGLLEREGRRPAGFLQSQACTGTCLRMHVNT